MFGSATIEKPGERSFVTGHVIGRSNASNDMLVAALAALGFEPDPRKPSSIVVGDGIKGDGNVTYYFDQVSNCGQYRVSEMIAAWEDESWHERNPEHPFAYIKCALLNLAAIQERNRKDTPLAKIQKGRKFALIGLNSTAGFERRMLGRLERR